MRDDCAEAAGVVAAETHGGEGAVEDVAKHGGLGDVDGMRLVIGEVEFKDFQAAFLPAAENVIEIILGRL